MREHKESEMENFYKGRETGLFKRTYILFSVFLVGGALFIAAPTKINADESVHDRSVETEGPAPEFKGKSNKLCTMVYRWVQGSLIPPDDAVNDSVPAAVLNLDKKCEGPVLLTFTSEVDAPDPGDYIHITMEAKCKKPKYDGGCNKGQVSVGDPGLIFLANGPVEDYASYAAQSVFEDLAPGVWKIRVYAGGDGTAELWYRFLKVEAYKN
jgi:hypothetical protein